MEIIMVNILQKQVLFIIVLLYSLVTCRYAYSAAEFSHIVFAVAVMVLNVLFCRLNALLQSLTYKLRVYSCIGFANLLKSRMRCDKAECWKHACQALVATLL